MSPLEDQRNAGRVEPLQATGDGLGLIGWRPLAKGPASASAGDLVHERFHRPPPRHQPLTSVTDRAARGYFAHGGRTVHVVDVLVDTMAAPLERIEAAFGLLTEHLHRGLVAAPDLVTFGPDAYRTAIATLLRCARDADDHFALVDVPPRTSAHEAVDWVHALRGEVGAAAEYGSLYYPWLRTDHGPLAPSAVVAALCGRAERAHAPFGVRWPHARGPLEGIVGFLPRRASVEGVASAGVNLLRVEPGHGVVVTGTRMLGQRPGMQFVHQRRTVSRIVDQLRHDTAWVPEAPHGPELAPRILRTLRARLYQLWQAGVLVGDGSTPPWSVRCATQGSGLTVQLELRPPDATEHITVEWGWTD